MVKIIDKNKLNTSVFEDFQKLQGQLFFNTVFGGGSYTFLLNKASILPIIVVDIRGIRNKLPACLYIKGKKYLFEIDDLSEFIKVNKITNLNLNHLIWCDDLLSGIEKIVDLVTSNNLVFNFYIHDFYTICPTINLLNQNLQYCDIPDPNVCRKCLREYPFSKHAFSFVKKDVKESFKFHAGSIEKWRKIWFPLFDVANQLIFPSKSALDIWLKANGTIRNQVSIINHDLSYLSNIKMHSPQKKLAFYQVYIIGDIGEHKGSLIIHQLLRMIEKSKLGICINIIGDYQDKLFENTLYLKQHGRFQHTELANILNSSEIDCFIMPSIWPETFSFVLHEMMATGLPIISFNLGAQSEFLSQYEEAVLVDSISANKMFEQLKIKYNFYLNTLDPLLKSDLSNKLASEVRKKSYKGVGGKIIKALRKISDIFKGKN